MLRRCLCGWGLGAGRGCGRPATLGAEAHGPPHTLPSQMGAARRTVVPWVPSRFPTDCVWGLEAAQQEAGSREPSGQGREGPRARAPGRGWGEGDRGCQATPACFRGAFWDGCRRHGERGVLSIGWGHAGKPCDGCVQVPGPGRGPSPRAVSLLSPEGPHTPVSGGWSREKRWPVPGGLQGNEDASLAPHPRGAVPGGGGGAVDARPDRGSARGQV